MSNAAECARPLSLPVIISAGSLIGLASTIKTVVAAHWLVLLPLILLGAPSLRAALSFAAGPVLIWLGIWTYFAATGRSHEFIDAVFSYNLVYSKAEQGLVPKLLAFFTKEKVFRTAVALWIAGGVGLLALPWRRDLTRSLLLAAYAAGSYLAVCLPGQFWPHYYLLMLPPLTLMAAGLVHRVHVYRRGLGMAAGITITIALLATQLPGYLLVEPDHLAWERYKDRMAWVRDQAKRVAWVTDPDDAIYVWSADAGFYYYARRRCASRYTMFGALLAYHPSTAQRRRLLIQDLERDKPRLILLPAVARPPFPELQAFIREHKYVSAGKDSRGMEILYPLERPIPPIDGSWNPIPPSPGGAEESR